MSNEPEIIYTAEATVTGGREGHARTSDGRLEVDLDVPSDLGGPGWPGTNPEQRTAASVSRPVSTSTPPRSTATSRSI